MTAQTRMAQWYMVLTKMKGSSASHNTRNALHSIRSDECPSLNSHNSAGCQERASMLTLVRTPSSVLRPAWRTPSLSDSLFGEI